MQISVVHRISFLSFLSKIDIELGNYILFFQSNKLDKIHIHTVNVIQSFLVFYLTRRENDFFFYYQIITLIIQSNLDPYFFCSLQNAAFPLTIMERDVVTINFQFHFKFETSKRKKWQSFHIDFAWRNYCQHVNLGTRREKNGLCELSQHNLKNPGVKPYHL